jgi:hypothetical protein
MTAGCSLQPPVGEPQMPHFLFISSTRIEHNNSLFFYGVSAAIYLQIRTENKKIFHEFPSWLEVGKQINRSIN